MKRLPIRVSYMETVRTNSIPTERTQLCTPKLVAFSYIENGNEYLAVYSKETSNLQDVELIHVRCRDIRYAQM